MDNIDTGCKIKCTYSIMPLVRLDKKVNGGNLLIMNCIFCTSKVDYFSVRTTGFYACKACGGIFKDRQQLLVPQKQKERYILHHNTYDNSSYIAYVEKHLNAICAILARHTLCVQTFLDYGSGQFPILTDILQMKITSDKAYQAVFTANAQLRFYDLLFAPHTAFFPFGADVINCLEVAEHFENPFEDFLHVYQQCKTGGLVIIATHFLDECKDFSTWWYKEDTTHISFFTIKALEMLAMRVGFLSCTRETSHISVLQK